MRKFIAGLCHSGLHALGSLFLVCAFFLSAAVLPAAETGTAPSLPLLTNAQQVIQLGQDAARRNPHPVRLRAVITYPSADVRNRLYVQDETAGIQITATNLNFRAEPGQLVEVEGTAAAGPFYVFVNNAAVRLLGSAPLPEPKRTPPSRLAAGHDFAQWLSLIAVVYDAAIRSGRLWLHVAADEHLFTVVVTSPPDFVLPADWIDAQVELRGVTWVFFGANNSPSGFRLHVPGTNFVTLLQPGNSNLFNRPLVNAESLRRAPPGGARVKVSGVVTHHSPAGSLSLRDATGPVHAQQLSTLLPDDHGGQYFDRSSQTNLQPGDLIELVGAPSVQRAVAPLLLHAEYKILGRAPPPEARSITQAQAADHDGELVRIKGRLVDRLSRRAGSVLDQTLWLQADDLLFEALLQTEKAVAIPGENNSLLEVTGVCALKPGQMNQLRSFRIHLRNPNDVRVVQGAPAWISAQTGKIIGTAAGMGLAALGWILMLRRRVQQQNERIHALSREADLQKQYRDLFNSQPDMFYRTDLAGRIQVCSPACERLLGYSSQELAGKHASELYNHPEEGRKLLEAVFERGSINDTEIQLRRKDGELATFSLTTRSVRDALENVVGTEGFVRDITKRKKAEEAARRSEAVTQSINYFATSLLEQDTEETILWDLAKNCVSKLGFVDCVVYLLDNDRKVLVQKAAFGPKCIEDRIVRDPIQIPLSQGIVGAVAASGLPELIADTSKDARYIVDDERRFSELAVPISANGQVIGVIDAEHPEKDFFTQEHLKIVAAIASLCANKLIRVRAERELRVINAELEERVTLRTLELKQANQELQQSEAHVRLIIDTALDAVITMGANGLIQGWNAQAEAIFGWTAREAIGQPLATTIIPPELRSAHERGLQHYFATGEGPVLNKRIEIVGLHRSGRQFPVELTIAPMKLGADTIFSAFVRDITERKRAETALQENEIRLRIMLKRREAFSTLGERLSGAASVDQAAAIIMDVSDELFGWDSCSFDLYSAEQDRTFSVLTMDVIEGKRAVVSPTVTGSTPSPIMRKTIHEGAQLILRKNPQQDRGPEFVPFGDSPRASASLMFVPIRNGSQVTGTLSIQSYLRDAYTESDLETLQALADYCSAAIERIQAEHQFRSIFENALEGICRTSPDGRLLAANPALARMLGYESPEELLRIAGNLGRQLYVDCNQWNEFINQVNEKDFVAGFEAEFRRKDGSHIWISQSGRAVRDARRTLRHYEGTLEDITERKRVEHELLRALAREKELGELKSNFVSMVSHEFRTPLEVILSSGEILERYLDRLQPEQRQEHLQAIHKNVRRMAGLMEEVLLLTKVDAGKMEFKPVAVDLPGFCRRLVDEILSATSYRCPIHFAAEDLPATCQADEGLLRHIFLNLLSNAVKYSPEGTPVQFTVKAQLGQALFRIEDRGLGIPAADQARLFQSFYRGKNVEHLSGTGLGLVIVKRCVQLHGGKIHFQSAEGAGTTFSVWLPLFGQYLDSSFETAFLARQTNVAPTPFETQ